MQNDYLSWRLEFETFEKGHNFNWTAKKENYILFPHNAYLFLTE